MKRAIIVHCWGGKPKYCWYPKTKQELEEKGFEVLVPEFPDTENPQLSAWLLKLTEVIGTPDEELYLIGHSLGCITIMRYLENLETKQQVGGVIFVAGFTNDLNFKELKNFFIDPINFDKIKKSANYFIAINSDNDPYVDLKYADIFEQKLGAKKIITPNMGHFSGPLDNPDSCTSLPDVAKSVL